MSPAMVAGVAAEQKAPLAPLLYAAAAPAARRRRALPRRCGRTSVRASASPSSKRICLRTSRAMKPNDAISHHLERRRRLAQAIARRRRAWCRPRPSACATATRIIPYRFDSHFYYLTGFAEPEAALVLTAQGKSILFCRDKNEEREIWDGFRHGPRSRARALRFDEAYPIAALDEKMAELLENQPALHYPVGADPEWDARVMRWLNAVRAKGARRHHGARSRAGRARPDRRHAPGEGRAGVSVMRAAARIASRGAPARHAGHAAGPPRVRDRGRAAPRIPPQRRAVPRVLADRGRRAERLRAALCVQRCRRCATASSS